MKMSENKFRKEVAEAEGGDVICYFIGASIASSAEVNIQVAALAQAAWEFAHHPTKVGVLVQRRSEKLLGKFEYLFIKSKGA
jgi:hypothetical protein